MYLTLTKVGRIQAQIIEVTISEVNNPDEHIPVDVYDVEEANDASVYPRQMMIKGPFQMKHGVPYQLNITMSSIGSRWKDNLVTGCICEGTLTIAESEMQMITRAVDNCMQKK